jgi:O-methyltransferase involved in polyketide biosynthesis
MVKTPMATVSGETLDGVSATTLWTLRNRATEAKRPDGVISDPWAIRLFGSISYDYGKFGRHSQTHVLRALAFDNAACNYLRTHPKASVVALAEGLQTTLWRLDSADVADQLTWYSLDLPPVMALRHKLLPPDHRLVELVQSALDRSWMDRIDTTHGVFVTAEGLLMYLARADALGLIADCAAKFPGGRMVFDTIPRWVSRRSLKGMKQSRHYTAPPMPFALTQQDARALADTIPGIRRVRDIPFPAGRGVGKLMGSPALDQVLLSRISQRIIVLDFA